MKPKSVEIYPIYICDCGNRHSESLDYVKRVGKILCGCGNLLELDYIETFNVSPVYKSAKKKSQSKKNTYRKKPETDYEDLQLAPIEEELEAKQNANIGHSTSCLIGKSELEKSIQFLVSLGWKKGESKKKVMSVAKQWSIQNNENVAASNFNEFANYLFFNH